MRSLVERINREVELKSLLHHPFYEMWNKGELSRDHLVGYSKEYFQVVKVVPELVEDILSKLERAPVESAIRGNLKEETEHVLLWRRFASSLGVSPHELSSHEIPAKTHHAISELKGATSDSFESAVAAMYAYELELPRISRKKIEGLKKFYHLDSEDALIYFRTHQEADVRHATVWRNVLENVGEETKEAAFLGARKSLEAQNRLLDSVMNEYVTFEQQTLKYSPKPEMSDGFANER